MPKFEYAPAPESRSVVSLRESYGLFINGEFAPSADGRAFKTISPATENKKKGPKKRLKKNKKKINNIK